MADATTRLDAALAAMEAAPEDGQARLAFYEMLAASELFLLLEGEPEGDHVAPRLFEVEGARYVLVFDREERLSGFAGSVPYVALSGRALAEMLSAEALGLALNPEVAPSSILLPAEAVAWLSGTLSNGPAEVETKAREFHAPHGLPERLLTALDARLAAAAGLADLAYLVGVTYENGAEGHMLGVVDPVPGAEQALARAVSEVLQFSGLEAAALDVGFFRAEDRAAARMARVGLRFDLPGPEPTTQTPGAAPGMDPEKPPRLR
jgi:hypothetical protein